MSCVDYCTVLPSWDFDKDPAEIVTYFFGQECRSGEEDESDISGTNCTVDFRKTLCLKCIETENGENEPLVISVTCKPQYRVSVCGIHIVSNTRIVELYDTSEGYLCSVRGSVQDTPLDEEGGEETETVYRCRGRLEEAQFGLSIKFPKTGNMNFINIYQIVLILHPELEDDHTEMNCNGMINMAKVKDYVTGMGDNITDNARMLMKNVEEYQKQRQSGLHEMMANVGAGGHGMEMMGLMSMFSMLGRSDRSQTSLQNDSTVSGQSGSMLHNGHSSTDQSGLPSINQMSRLEQLLQSSRNSARDEAGENDDSKDNEMFGMLRNICSKVTKAREAEKKNEAHRESGEEHEMTNEDKDPRSSAQRCEKSEVASNERTTANVDINERLDGIEKRLEHHVSLQVKEAEERLRNHFDTRLSELEEKIYSKMDQLLLLFHNNGRSPSD